MKHIFTISIQKLGLENRGGIMDIKQKIEAYVSNLLYQHDLAAWRNENNQKG